MYQEKVFQESKYGLIILLGMAIVFLAMAGDVNEV